MEQQLIILDTTPIILTIHNRKKYSEGLSRTYENKQISSKLLSQNKNKKCNPQHVKKKPFVFITSKIYEMFVNNFYNCFKNLFK